MIQLIKLKIMPQFTYPNLCQCLKQGRMNSLNLHIRYIYSPVSVNRPVERVGTRLVHGSWSWRRS